MKNKTIVCIIMAAFILEADLRAQPELDRKVEAFLNSRRYRWRDMNVPEADGRKLYDVIISHGYTSALEIGTSTGHSGIWIAWALSKSGGRLITIEIDERRYREALANFREAGLEDYVDARLADAHALVPDLQGPFDFVFSDADKYWYKNYLKDVLPKLEPGACFTAHNVSRMSRDPGIREFLQYLESLENMETTLFTEGAGMSVSYWRGK